MSNIEELYREGILGQEEFLGIITKIKDKGNVKEWCDEYVCILSSICERAQCYRYLHEKSNSHYKTLSYRITYASMFFSGLMSGFSIISTKMEYIIPVNLAALISGLGHLVIAGVTGFQKRMNLPESAEMHEKASQDFDIFCRNIEFQLTLPIDDRQSVPKLVFETIDKYENLVISNPPIPHRILNYFRHNSERFNINKPSIVNAFSIMPKNLNDNIMCKSNNPRNIWTPCQQTRELKKYKTKGRKMMPELSPTIKKLNKRSFYDSRSDNDTDLERDNRRSFNPRFTSNLELNDINDINDINHINVNNLDLNDINTNNTIQAYENDNDNDNDNDINPDNDNDNDNDNDDESSITIQRGHF